MKLPGIKIQFAKGVLGGFNTSEDGVLGLLATAAAVAGKFELNKPYKITGMAEVAKLGLVKGHVQNGRLYKTLSEFYTEAGEGTALWIMGMAAATRVSDWFTTDAEGKYPAALLLDSAKGEIKGLLTSYSGTATPALVEGLGNDVMSAVIKAQLFAKNYTDLKYAPVFVLMEGWGFAGSVTALPDLSSSDCNRVGILIGDTIGKTQPGYSNYGAAIGVLGGRVAKSAVHINVARVADGALSITEAWVVDEAAEVADFTGLNEKGYLCFRYHQGKGGYYFTDDHLATAVEDDCHFLTRRRTIDKAYRIAYTALLNVLLDNVPTDNDNKLQRPWCKSVEGMVESAIAGQMTGAGELSADKLNKDDRGVVCFINPNQNILATGKLQVVIKVRPFGYARYIDVTLGFATDLAK